MRPKERRLLIKPRVRVSEFWVPKMKVQTHNFRKSQLITGSVGTSRSSLYSHRTTQQKCAAQLQHEQLGTPESGAPELEE